MIKQIKKYLRRNNVEVVFPEFSNEAVIAHAIYTWKGSNPFWKLEGGMPENATQATNDFLNGLISRDELRYLTSDDWALHVRNAISWHCSNLYEASFELCRQACVANSSERFNKNAKLSSAKINYAVAQQSEYLKKLHNRVCALRDL